MSLPSSTMSISPLSSPRSPLPSDTSFASIHTIHSERKHSPPLTTIPAPLSTSTISRDSRASADDRPITKVSSCGTPLLDSCTTRIPKARVFLHREQRPDRPRPKYQSCQSSHVPRTHSPANLSSGAGARRSLEKRCVSDLHDAFQAHQLRVKRTPTPAPEAWKARRGIPDFSCGMLGHDEDVPDWILDEDEEDWKPSPDCDPCIVESHSNKWVSSLRNISNLCKKETKTPCVRTSILDVQPPTLTERLGFCALGGERKHGYREVHARNLARNRLIKRSKSKLDELTRKNSPTNVTCLPDAEVGGETARDDYVGFLVQTQEKRIPRPRRSWLRFLRRTWNRA